MKMPKVPTQKQMIVLMIIAIVSINAPIFSIFATQRFFETWKFVGKSPIRTFELSFQFPLGLERRLVSEASRSALVPQAEAKTVIRVEVPKTIENASPLTVVMNKRHGVILWGIFGRESTWGKESISGNWTYCRSLGKYNGFGYGWNGVDRPCFDSFDEIATKVDDWFDKYIQQFGGDLEQTLCFYNTGKITKTCNYASDVITLSKQNR